jgi:hypothetical protein
VKLTATYKSPESKVKPFPDRPAPTKSKRPKSRKEG